MLCVSKKSCEIAAQYLDHLGEAHWTNPNGVERKNSNGVYILTNSNSDQPSQVSDLRDGTTKKASRRMADRCKVQAENAPKTVRYFVAKTDLLNTAETPSAK
jgi:hypothetical protein